MQKSTKNITASDIIARRRMWLRALRSGKYNQAKNYLYNEACDGYCCLGVASKITGNRLGLVEEGDNHSYNSIAKFYGLNKKQWQRLATMNDKEGKSFKEIAAFISKNWLKERTVYA